MPDQTISQLIADLRGSRAEARRAARDLVATGTEAVDAIIEAITASSDTTLRLYGAQALGQIGDPRAVDILQRLTESDSLQVRYAAEDALKRIEREQGDLPVSPPDPVNSQSSLLVVETDEAEDDDPLSPDRPHRIPVEMILNRAASSTEPVPDTADRTDTSDTSDRYDPGVNRPKPSGRKFCLICGARVTANDWIEDRHSQAVFCSNRCADLANGPDGWKYRK